MLKNNLALIGQVISEKKMFDNTGYIRVYIPGTGADNPCRVLNGVCRPLEEKGSFCVLLPTCPVSEVAPVGLIPRFLVLITY